jgi:ABC-2 type transport system ATP-binding protein
MIEVSHLTKRYGDQYAVNDISFEVNDGEILGFLGPNGAGKSTTMNIITGYLSSNEGTVKVGGIDVLENPVEAKKHIGFLPELPPLYLDMTVREYLSFVYDLKGCKLPRDAHLGEICDLVRISGVYDRMIKNLSKGYRQRVGIAQALVGNPDVLILDEPTVGLDPKQIIEIRTLIKHLGKKHTVILSSHILPEVQSVCERIVIINRGIIVADGTTADLSSRINSDHRVVIRVAGPEEPIERAIRGITGVVEVESLGSREQGAFDFQVEAQPGRDIRRPLFTLMADRRWPILSLDSGELTLEDIFLKLTSEDIVKKIKRDRKKEADKSKNKSGKKESKAEAKADSRADDETPDEKEPDGKSSGKEDAAAPDEAGSTAGAEKETAKDTDREGEE